MTHHHHEHSGSSGHTHKKIHKDWRLWLGVATMLAAILIYVLTMDESV